MNMNHNFEKEKQFSEEALEQVSGGLPDGKVITGTASVAGTILSAIESGDEASAVETYQMIGSRMMYDEAGEVRDTFKKRFGYDIAQSPYYK